MKQPVEKCDDLKASDKREILKQFDGRKTPQLRLHFESIICAQKLRAGTFVDNWIEHEVGLIDLTQTLKGKTPATVMTVEKEEEARCNGHLTFKPLRVCEHLIRLFTKRSQIVLRCGPRGRAAQHRNRRQPGLH